MRAFVSAINHGGLWHIVETNAGKAVALAEALRILDEVESGGQHETLATLNKPDAYSAEKRSALAEALQAFVEE